MWFNLEFVGQHEVENSGRQAGEQYQGAAFDALQWDQLEDQKTVTSRTAMFKTVACKPTLASLI